LKKLSHEARSEMMTNYTSKCSARWGEEADEVKFMKRRMLRQLRIITNY